LNEALRVLVGPTGAGKTALLLALADDLPIEVLSLDSVQVYRGLDIGSAKPTRAERARLPHHLVDLVEPDARFTAADWLAACERAIAEVRSRDRVPIVAGGTGLYLRLLTTGLAPLPPADDALRARLLAEEEAAPGALHARLTAIDPASAARIAPRDRVRLVRALEVAERSGRPLSQHLAAHAAARADRPLRVVYLDPPDDALCAALERRTEAMMRAGLVDEARGLRARFGPVRALDALGYKEALELVDGRFHPSELGARIVAASRQFARRQRTWFGKAPGALRVVDAAAARAALSRS